MQVPYVRPKTIYNTRNGEELRLLAQHACTLLQNTYMHTTSPTMQVAIRASKYTWVVGHKYLREPGGVVELAKVYLQLEMVDITLKDVGRRTIHVGPLLRRFCEDQHLTPNPCDGPLDDRIRALVTLRCVGRAWKMAFDETKELYYTAIKHHWEEVCVGTLHWGAPIKWWWHLTGLVR